MNEDTVFDSTVKVITRNYGVSNDPVTAGQNYQADDLAPTDARIFLLSNSRFVTSGSATFLVGTPELYWAGAVYPIAADTDMDPSTIQVAEVWINTRDIITIVEEP
jgi:hypothetical protein